MFTKHIKMFTKGAGRKQLAVWVTQPMASKPWGCSARAWKPPSSLHELDPRGSLNWPVPLFKEKTFF